MQEVQKVGHVQDTSTEKYDKSKEHEYAWSDTFNYLFSTLRTLG